MAEGDIQNHGNPEQTMEPTWAQRLQAQLQQVDEHVVDLNEALLMLVAVRASAGPQPGEAQDHAEGTAPSAMPASQAGETPDQASPALLAAVTAVREEWQQWLGQAQHLLNRGTALVDRIERLCQRAEADEAGRPRRGVPGLAGTGSGGAGVAPPLARGSWSGRPSGVMLSGQPDASVRPAPEPKVRPLRPAASSPTVSSPPASLPRGTTSSGSPRHESSASSSPRRRWRWW
ncbi:MAG: hypothetical protein IMX01_02520 [Limnochordaceae bacterium]|nr:hypothetical protein [Limnochordaceae bacterium]